MNLIKHKIKTIENLSINDGMSIIAFSLMLLPYAHYWRYFTMDKDEILSLVLSNGNEI